jgi:hypothetical protein
MTDLQKEFKEKLNFWDEYYFEKSKVSEQVYAYIEWLEKKDISQLHNLRNIHRRRVLSDGCNKLLPRRPDNLRKLLP